MFLHILLEGIVAHFNVAETVSNEKPHSVEGVGPYCHDYVTLHASVLKP